MTRYRMPSPVGDLVVAADGDTLVELAFADEPGDEPPLPLDHSIRRQLDDYFAGHRQSFELDLAPAGSPFQLRVWRALADIPYGETISYGQLAHRIGDPKAVRAVGQANNRNPIAIVLPCHRVVGAGGDLVGYGGGLARKRALLELEGAPGQLALF